jgi:hypothetical protein
MGGGGGHCYIKVADVISKVVVTRWDPCFSLRFGLQPDDHAREHLKKFLFVKDIA